VAASSATYATSCTSQWSGTGGRAETVCALPRVGSPAPTLAEPVAVGSAPALARPAPAARCGSAAAVASSRLQPQHSASHEHTRTNAPDPWTRTGGATT
jgi:hypothetical protein